MFKTLSLLVHYWNRKRLFEKKYREAVPYATRDSAFEQEKYRRQLDLIKGRRYRRALEVGCGEGVFTIQLAPLSDQVVGVDIAEEAIRRAKKIGETIPQVSFRVDNLASMDVDGTFDLIVATDVLYYLGQEHGWDHLQAVLSRLVKRLDPGGRFLLCHCHTGPSHEKDWLSSRVMRRYREECERLGLILVKEAEFQGVNDTGHTVPYLVSVLERTAKA